MKSSTLGLVALIIISFTILAYSAGQNHNKAVAAQKTAISAQAAADEATRALCNVRRSYSDAVKQTTDYLKAHPDGAPALHLSRAYFLRSIKANRDKEKSLSDIDCSKVPVVK